MSVRSVTEVVGWSERTDLRRFCVNIRLLGPVVEESDWEAVRELLTSVGGPICREYTPKMEQTRAFVFFCAFGAYQVLHGLRYFHFGPWKLQPFPPTFGKTPTSSFDSHTAISLASYIFGALGWSNEVLFVRESCTMPDDAEEVRMNRMAVTRGGALHSRVLDSFGSTTIPPPIPLPPSTLAPPKPPLPPIVPPIPEGKEDLVADEDDEEDVDDEEDEEDEEGGRRRRSEEEGGVVEEGRDGRRDGEEFIRFATSFAESMGEERTGDGELHAVLEEEDGIVVAAKCMGIGEVGEGCLGKEGALGWERLELSEGALWERRTSGALERSSVWEKGDWEKVEDAGMSGVGKGGGWGSMFPSRDGAQRQVGIRLSLHPPTLKHPVALNVVANAIAIGKGRERRISDFIQLMTKGAIGAALVHAFSCITATVIFEPIQPKRTSDPILLGRPTVVSIQVHKSREEAYSYVNKKKTSSPPTTTTTPSSSSSSTSTATPTSSSSTPRIRTEEETCDSPPTIAPPAEVMAWLQGLCAGLGGGEDGDSYLPELDDSLFSPTSDEAALRALEKVMAEIQNE